MWCKVKGHSKDAINDRADALATDGRDAVTAPRGLELAPPHQLHAVEDWLTRRAGPEAAAVPVFFRRRDGEARLLRALDHR